MNADYAYRAKTERARTARRVLSVPIEIILPAGVLIALAMSIAGLAAGTYWLFGGREQAGPTLSRR